MDAVPFKKVHGGGCHPPLNFKINVIFNANIQKLMNFGDYSLIHNNTILNLNSMR